MGRLTHLRIHNYRSISDWVRVDMPERGPLVLLGENNAGKSNIIGALSIILGETWPGNFHPEDHDFHDRDRENLPIHIVVGVEGVRHGGRTGSFDITEMTLKFNPEDDEGRPCAFDVWGDNGQSAWGSNADRAQLACAVVGADRRLQYQLSYASKWTLLARLMRGFHERLVADAERVERLRERFDEIVDIFREVEAFSAFDAELRRMASELAANLRYGLEMDFSAYDPSNYFRSLRVYPTADGSVRTFDELGTGQEQILAVAFAYAYARAYSAGDGGLVMVIEEPEAHLHPIAQRWLGQKISELHEGDVQMIVTTHSPAFVDLANPSSLVCVRKPDLGGATKVIQHSKPALAKFIRTHGATNAESESIGPFYAASATGEHVVGLFARACVVVEGPTEALAVPELLAAVQFDVLEHGLAIVAAGGIGAIARWLRLYWAFEIPAFAIFDRDSQDDPQGFKRENLLATLGTSQDAYGDLLAGDAPLAFGDGFAVFNEDFESALRELFPEYSNLEESVRAEVGTAKPLVAREACRRLGEDHSSPGWASIAGLASVLDELERPLRT